MVIDLGECESNPSSVSRIFHLTKNASLIGKKARRVTRAFHLLTAVIPCHKLNNNPYQPLFFLSLSLYFVIHIQSTFISTVGYIKIHDNWSHISGNTFSSFFFRQFPCILPFPSLHTPGLPPFYPLSSLCVFKEIAFRYFWFISRWLKSYYVLRMTWYLKRQLFKTEKDDQSW